MRGSWVGMDRYYDASARWRRCWKSQNWWTYGSFPVSPLSLSSPRHLRESLTGGDGENL